MRTALILVGGFVLLLLLLAATQKSGRRTAARVSLGFIVLWLLVAAGNAWLGVQDGHTLAEELPIALLIFVPPAVPAAIVWAKNRTAKDRKA